MELHITNLQLQDAGDWTLIIDSIEFSLLSTLDLGAESTNQFVSTTAAANLFISRMEQALMEAEGAKLLLKVLTLNIAALSQPELALVQKIFSVCRLQKFHIECSPFDPRLSDFIAQMLASVHWTSLGCLNFTGDNIDE